MANQKISQLTEKTTLDGSEQIPFAESGQNGKMTVQSINDFVQNKFAIKSETSGSTLEINELTTSFVPTEDFTISCGTVKEGLQYILRINSSTTAYSITLGSGITNPFSEDLTLTASKMTTIIFFATSSSDLEIFAVRTAE